MRFREIFEYIMTTPGNTNPAILKQMMDSYVARSNNELYNYTVDADIADSVDLLGKKASDLQSDVFVVDGVVYGTLKYVTGFTGFSSSPAEQKGHYIALHFEYDGADSIKVGGVTLDSDGLHIIRFQNPVKKDRKIAIEITKDDESIVDYIDLSNIDFE